MAVAPPFYVPAADELDVFRAAFDARLPLMLKGPTGCGKTRLVEHMAHRLGVGLVTVSCHEDMTASDLLGRFLLADGETRWVDGPLTRAAREGCICYLDEVVEARQDATVAIHSLTDHRRELSLERLGGQTVRAADAFMLVISYNPGYQSVLKDLKVSTRQRMVSVQLAFPPPDIERDIVMAEAQVDAEIAGALVRLAGAIRRVKDAGLREVPSTRTLIAAGRLMAGGLPFQGAVDAAIVHPLTDDAELRDGLAEMVRTYDAA